MCIYKSITYTCLPKKHLSLSTISSVANACASRKKSHIHVSKKHMCHLVPIYGHHIVFANLSHNTCVCTAAMAPALKRPAAKAAEEETEEEVPATQPEALAIDNGEEGDKNSENQSTEPKDERKSGKAKAKTKPKAKLLPKKKTQKKAQAKQKAVGSKVETRKKGVNKGSVLKRPATSKKIDESGNETGAAHVMCHRTLSRITFVS